MKIWLGNLLMKLGASLIGNPYPATKIGGTI